MRPADNFPAARTGGQSGFPRVIRPAELRQLGGGQFLNRIHKPAFPIRIAQAADKLLQCIGIFRQQVADQEDFAVARTEKTAV